MILENIKALCAKRGISIAQLEKQAGIGNGVIDDWDHSTPNVKSIMAVSKVLGVSVDKLLKGAK